MKLFHLYFCSLLFILIGCGPELQTVVNRDKYNRIILEAELKGEADTLWSKIYTYHYVGPLSPSQSNQVADVTVDDSGNAAWGAEEEPAETPIEETPVEADSLAPKQYIITVDSTKKNFSSFAKGNKEGEWKTWYPNGMLNTEYFYQKNQIEGLYSYYDSLGTVTKTETYKKSILEGVTSDFNENGALIKTTDYKKGIVTGFVKEFLEGVVLLEQKTYKKDSLDGEWTSWYDNGTQKVVRLYNNGTPIGNWIFNDQKGAWMREEQYKKGLAHGIWSFYDKANDKVFQYYTMGKLIAEYTEAKWPNGQLKEVPSFKNGLPDGTWIGYWADGSTRYTIDYKKGDKDGNELRYDSTGVLIFEVKYSKGIRNGIEKEYFSNGQLKRSAKYKDNKLNGKTEHFDSLGVKLETIAYKDSLRDGKTTIWWPNGEPHKRLTYEKEILEGEYEEWFPSGKLYTRFNYEKGILDGEYEEWDSLGADIVKGYYVQGTRDKKWLYYDSEGRRDKFIFLEMDSLITDYEFKYYPNWQIVEEPGFNDRGLFDGKWESFYIDGATSKKYQYDDGKKNKDWQSYYQDGRRDNYTFYDQDSLVTDYDFTYYSNLQIMEEPKFSKQGLFDGKWESFYENGDTWRTFYYNEGNKIKLWSVFYDSTGTRQSETNYENDLKEGMYYQWYETVKEDSKEEGLYVEDKKHEIWSYWNEFAEKRLEVWELGVLLHSYKYEYYENGQVKEEPSYVNGKMHGDWFRYFPNGDIKGTRVFRENLKEGLWMEFHRNPPGKSDDILAWQGEYIADMREGKWEWFWLNTNLQRLEIFKNDEITLQECYERNDGVSKRECLEVR